MNIIQRHRLAALLALFALLGCARARPVAQVPAAPKPPEDAWSWLPEDSTVLARALPAELKKSAFLRQAQAGGAPPLLDVDALSDAHSWVELARVQRVTLGGHGNSPEQASYVAALEGDFRADELSERAQREQVVGEPHGPLVVYRKPDQVWVQITPKLILTCTPDRLSALLARATAGPTSAAKQTPLYRAFGERIGFERMHLALLVDDPDGSRRAQLERRAARIGLESLTRDLTRAAVGLQVGAEYQIAGLAETSDAARAEALQGELRALLGTLGNNLIVRMLGLSGLLGRISVSAEGNSVRAQASVPEAELATALERLQGAIGLASSVGL